MEGRAVRAVGEFDCGLGKVRETSNGKVFLVRVGGSNNVLCLLYAVEDIRLAVLIAVGTNTKVDLARILVGLESLSNT